MGSEPLLGCPHDLSHVRLRSQVSDDFHHGDCHSWGFRQDHLLVDQVLPSRKILEFNSRGQVRFGFDASRLWNCLRRLRSSRGRDIITSTVDSGAKSTYWKVGKARAYFCVCIGSLVRRYNLIAVLAVKKQWTDSQISSSIVQLLHASKGVSSSPGDVLSNWVGATAVSSSGHVHKLQ